MWVLIVFILGSSQAVSFQEFNGQAACQRALAIATTTAFNDSGYSLHTLAYCTPKKA
jgi:hypothetical protein